MGTADAGEPPCSSHMNAPVEAEQWLDSGDEILVALDQSAPEHHECCALSTAVLGEFKAIQNLDSASLAGILVRALLPAFGPQNADRWTHFLPRQAHFSSSGSYLLHRVILR